jgi:CRP-like cAMP-binding protein
VENGELASLISAMAIEFYSQGDILFKEGDPGNKFYIIYDGRIGISIEGKGIVTELKKGDSFGELSLLFGQTRAGTAVVLERTELISLTRESYELIIKVRNRQKTHTNLCADHFKFLKTVPLFANLSKQSARYLTQIAQLKRCAAQQTIICQGDTTGYIYLIYSGAVKLFKDIRFRVPESNETESLVRSVDGYELAVKRKIFLEEVGQGYIIGAYEFFNSVPMQYSAVCSMPSSIFIFDKYILEKIDAESIQQFKEMLKPYVCDRLIKEKYVQDQKWKIFKTRLMKNVKIEKEHEKKVFLTQRSPIRMQYKNLSLGKIKLPRLASTRSSTQMKIRTPHKTPTFGPFYP